MVPSPLIEDTNDSRYVRALLFEILETQIRNHRPGRGHDGWNGLVGHRDVIAIRHSQTQKMHAWKTRGKPAQIVSMMLLAMVLLSQPPSGSGGRIKAAIGGVRKACCTSKENLVPTIRDGTLLRLRGGDIHRRSASEQTKTIQNCRICGKSGHNSRTCILKDGLATSASLLSETGHTCRYTIDAITRIFLFVVREITNPKPAETTAVILIIQSVHYPARK